MQRSTHRATSMLALTIPLLIATSTVRAASIDAIWLGGADNWSNSGQWSGGVVPNDNGVDTYNVFIDDGNAIASNVVLDLSVFITNLTIDADDALTIGNTRRLRVVAGTIDNAGTLEIGSTGSGTYLHPRGGPVTLTGGGTLQLSNQANNWLYQEAGGSLINVDNTIRGSGNLGWTSSPTSFDNQGTIVADQSTPLILQGGTGSGVINTGTIRAENGATLECRSATIDNTNGIIEALDASHISLSSTTILGGTLQTSGSGVIETENTLNAINGQTQTVQNTGTLRILNADALYAVGTIENTGTIEIASTGSTSILHASDAPLMLAGGGTLAMSDNGNNWIRQNAGGSLVNVDNTIRGSGNIGWTSLPLNIDNQALIVADQTTPLAVQGGTGVTCTNTGTLRAENSATLAFATANVVNTNGIIEALDDSHVELDSTTITGGTLRTSGTGTIDSVDAQNALVDVTNEGSLRVRNAARIYLGDTIHNTGVMSLDSTGSNTYFHVASDPVMLTGGGTLQMSNQDNNWIYQQSAGSLVNVDNTIRGSGFLGWTSAPTNITNQGLIVADQPTPLEIHGGTNSTFTNTGVVRAENGATAEFVGANVNNAGGTIEALDASIVALTSTGISGGTLQTSGTGVIEAANTTSLLAGLTNTGKISIPNAKRLYLSGPIHNTGTIELASISSNTYLYVNSDPVTLTGGGTIAMSDSDNNWIYRQGDGSLVNIDNTIRGSGNLGWISAPTSITNQGTIIADQPTDLVLASGNGALFDNQGTMIVDGAGGMSIVGPFETSGDVTVNATRMLTRNGAYTQTGGSTTVDGTLVASGNVEIDAGLLGGNGSIDASVTNAGTTAPGASVGTLTIEHDYTQTAQGELHIEIDGSGNDLLDILGSAALDGALTLNFAIDPPVGTAYEILHADGGVSGTFNAINLTCLPGGKSVYVGYTPDAVLLTIGDSLAADTDCDCALSMLDVELFTLAMLDPAAYDAATPNCIGLDAVDMNNDGSVNGLDIQPFLAEFLP